MGYNLENGVVVGANLTPTSQRDTFPTHLDIYGRGGYKAVRSKAERDAIPDDRLSIGCEVRVTDATSSTVYYLKSLSPKVWEEVKGGGLDLSALEEIKNQPGGIIGADGEGKVPEQQSRGIVFRGKYIDTTNFQHPNGNSLFPKLENAIYVDNATGHIYTWTNDQFVRDTLYWIEVK